MAPFQKIDSFNPYVSGKVFDMACGDGKLHKFLEKNLEINMVGVDAEKSEVTDYIHDLNEKFPKSWKADTIVSVDTIEHLGNPLGFLKECFRMLSKGGKVLVFTPNMIGLPYLLERYKKGVDWRKDHLCGFNKMMLEKLLKDSGFKVIRSELVNDYPLRSYRIFGKVFCDLFKRFRPALFAVGKKI